MKFKDLSVVVIGLVATAALPVLLTWRRDRIAEKPMVQEIPTPQAQRVTDFIREAESLKSFESAVAALDERESDVASMALTSAALMTSEISGKVVLNSVLADRRVSRIFSYLVEMDRDVARAKCLALFDKCLAGLNAEWTRFAPMIKDAQGPWICLELRRKHHALSAAVFLCTRFCSYDDCRGLCRRWRSRMETVLKESEFDPAEYEQKAGLPLEDVFPDDLFEMNVGAILLAQIGKSFAGIQQETSVVLPQVTTHPYSAWDEIRDPNQKDAGERQVVYLAGWRPVILPGAKQQALGVVRSILDKN